MLKKSKIRRQPVELNPPVRPSKIRREHVPGVDGKPMTLFGNVDFHSREWEIRFAIVGITFFALGISAVVLDVADVLSH